VPESFATARAAVRLFLKPSEAGLVSQCTSQLRSSANYINVNSFWGTAKLSFRNDPWIDGVDVDPCIIQFVRAWTFGDILLSL
jgi:hypothetical protein